MRDMPPILGVVFLIVGIVGSIFPEFMWFIHIGWKVNGDIEPSDTYLIITRIMCFVIAIASIPIILGIPI